MDELGINCPRLRYQLSFLQKPIHKSRTLRPNFSTLESGAFQRSIMFWISTVSSSNVAVVSSLCSTLFLRNGQILLSGLFSTSNALLKASMLCSSADLASSRNSLPVLGQH